MSVTIAKGQNSVAPGHSELAKQQGSRERAAQFAIRAALWEAFFGNQKEARLATSDALAQAGNRESHALAGDSTNARTQYKESLSHWKDADSDLPVVRQAKSELAKLN